MNDVFICDYIRTPIGRYGGALSSVRTDDLAAIPLSALARRNPTMALEEIDEVILGCANQAGEDNRNVARMATLLAGFPETVPGTTINRLCGSGMDAIIMAARAIKSGECDLMIAGGVESMSRAPFVMPKAQAAFSRSNEVHDTTIGWRFVNSKMAEQYGVDTMPETGENVASEFAISRIEQDRFALGSQQKAKTAQQSGRFAKEIEPVPIADKKNGSIFVRDDQHPRPSTTLEHLQKLRAPFRENGTVTAGNSSGVNDGAAAVILATAAAARKHGLTPIAKFLGGAASGVPPRIMGIGPVSAIRVLLQRLMLDQQDFGVFELNEAFAAQSLATLKQLGIEFDDNRVNPNGGAIALGHPLGMSGTRIAGTAALELSEQKTKRALAAMCVGVGQGIAIAIEAV